MDYSTWTHFARSMAEGGILTALSSICLLYYVIHLHHLSQERREHQNAKQALCGLENVLRTTQNECTLAVVESELLRHFLAGQSVEQTLQLIMRQFIPIPEQGWVAYIELQPEPHVILCRGDCQMPTHPIDLNDETLAPALVGGIVSFHQPRVNKSRFLSSFGAHDCRRFDHLYVLGIGTADQIYGLLVTTHLFPMHAPLEQQFELAYRMTSGLARHIAAIQSKANRDRELQKNTDRLTIRTLFDQDFENPFKMLQQFLRTTQLILNSDRGVLFFTAPIGVWESTSYMTTGEVPEGFDCKIWYRCEDQLAHNVGGLRDRVLFDEFGLQLMDLNQSFKSALLMPVEINRKPVGMLCFTRASNESFTIENQQLIAWAVEVMAEKLSSAIEQAEFRKLAQVDAVTHIANRHTFDRELEREIQIAYATNSEFSMILFDLDRFKAINDTYGHQAGDEALRVTAQLLSDSLSHLRAGDRAFCARFGGEEFAVILPGVGPVGTARIADLIRGHIEKAHVEWDGQVISMTISGGVATYPEHGATSAEMISAADRALYQAKRQGRNRIGFASPPFGIPSSGDSSSEIPCPGADIEGQR